MKTLIAIAALFVNEVALAEEKTDWNTLASNLIGQWQGPEMVPGSTFSNAKPIPRTDSVLIIRDDGSALVRNFFGSAPMFGEDEQDVEFHYIFNRDVIVFYSPEDKALSKTVRFKYRIKDSTLELDYLGGASVTTRLKKVVEEGDAHHSATRPESKTTRRKPVTLPAGTTIAGQTGTARITQVGQDGAGQPATTRESKPEGKEKP